MKHPFYASSLILCTVLTCAAADGNPTVVPEPINLTRLVSGGTPPMTGFEHEHKSFLRKDALGIVGRYLGPAFNVAVVNKELQKRFAASVKQGWTEADRFGQKGMLVRVTLRVREADAGPFYRLADDGVAFVGAGPNADAVCLAERCGTELKSITAPGEKVSEGSGYYWFEPDTAGKLNMRSYKLEKMEESVKFISFNEYLLKHTEESARQAALDGYAKKLAEVTKSAKDSEQVQRLLSERDESRKKLYEVERQLAAEMERVKKAADAAETLAAYSTVFSLASSIALANASTGENINALAGGEIKSKEALLSVLKTLTASSGKKVEALRLDSTTYSNKATGSETQLLNIGILYKMDPKDNHVIKPRVN